MHRQCAVVVLMLTMLLSWASPVTADKIEPFSDNWFNRQFDWVVSLKLDTMDRFLKYPSSTMNPITRVAIDYRFTPNRFSRKDRITDRQKYEELWYHDGKAVGCKRYQTLELSSSEQGCLYIRPDPKVGDSIRELTNAIVRLVLDVYDKKSILASIIVPKDNFENFATALAQYHFFKLTMVYPGGPGNNMSIHVMSDPYGMERYYYYDDTGRR